MPRCRLRQKVALACPFVAKTAVARGEVWLVNLSPTVGHEQEGKRPALVVSVNRFNDSAAELVVVLPITSQVRILDWHVDIMPNEGGVKTASQIMCHQPRAISTGRLIERWGKAEGSTMKQVAERLRKLLGL
jgi:mRNA interferase MazF